MQRSMWLNVVLAAAVAALGAWVYFKPGQDAPVGHPLSALKPTEVGSIRIERPGEPAIVLEKKRDAWFVTAPFAARGNDVRARQLVEIVEARTAHQFAATDLGRFELDQPQARVTLGGQTFSFGMVSPVSREQYLLTDGAVFAVHPRYGTALPANAGELASRQLFGPGETPVRFEMKSFTVEQRDGKWRLAPEAQGLSQDDFVRWSDEWRRAAALRVEPSVRGKPVETVRIQLKEGGALSLGILAREPELVLLRADEKLQYHFRPDVAKRLLSPPGAGVRSETADKK